MRNFWMDASIDGRKSELVGGPASKDGGMNVVIRQRVGGLSKVAFRIECYANGDELVTSVFDKDGQAIAKFTSKR